jgi:hypothetical protein
MSEYGKLAKAVGGLPVATYTVFFDNEKNANACARKCNAEVEALDDGWLVKKHAVPVSDADPIIQTIWKAVEEFKAKSTDPLPPR